MTRVKAAEEIVGALPPRLVRLEVVPRAGHFTWLDAPDVFWPLVIDFVERSNDRATA